MMKKDCDNKVVMQMRVSGQFHFFFFFFFMKRFYTHKNHKIQTSGFYADIFIRQKVLKCKQATFIHKKQQNAK